MAILLLLPAESLILVASYYVAEFVQDPNLILQNSYLVFTFFLPHHAAYGILVP